jgi:PAS domain S-box-containing protein
MSIPIEDSLAVRRAARPGSTPSTRGAHNRFALKLADVCPAGRTGGAYGETAWGILESTPDAIWVFDAATLRLTYANNGLLRHFGYRVDELVAGRVGRIAPELTDGRLRQLLAPLDAGSSDSIVHNTFLRRIDGVDVPVEVRTHAVAAGEDGQPRTYVSVARDVTDRGAAETKRRHGAVESGIREDRDRIARDLHDGVIQRLFATAMSVHALRRRPATLGLDADLSHIVDELDETIVEIRSLIYRLSPDEPSADFQSDMRAVVDEEHAALGLTPTVRFTGDAGSVGGEWRRHVLFIFRELLSNIARHARATRVDVDVEVGEMVLLRVADDGRGFDPNQVAKGRGVRNMSERARALGGSILIRAHPGGGCVVECLLPLPRMEVAAATGGR